MSTTPRLTKLQVRGFRSVHDVSLELGPLNLLIGPNGAGKSNILSVLRMIPMMRTQSLRGFVSEQGGASAILHFGPSHTREIELQVDFQTDTGTSIYYARLGYAAGDTFVFLEESVSFKAPDYDEPLHISFGAGHSESALRERARDADARTESFVNRLVGGISFFHFHDTSLTSPLRQNARASEDGYLRSDGSNLASFLYSLKTDEDPASRASWKLIEGHVKRIAPFIKALEPEALRTGDPRSAIRLYWVDERDHRFDVHDLSDGTLRAIALITALGQPPKSLPEFICIDEPELGLHPAAMNIVSALIRSVSSHSQIILSTQSPIMLDEFRPEEVIIAENPDGVSTFRRLCGDDLVDWLSEYTLSELYDKNVLGGRP